MIISLVENFENIHQRNVKEMLLTLHNSSIDVDYIVGYPTYTFSDGSTIGFPHGRGGRVSQYNTSYKVL